MSRLCPSRYYGDIEDANSGIVVNEIWRKIGDQFAGIL